MGSVLSPQQMKFVDNIHAGSMSLTSAYLDAGYKDGKGKYAAASKLLRNDKVIAELAMRLDNRKVLAGQRFGHMLDGSTNVYVTILKIKTNDDPRLLELQRKVATDVFDRSGLKPKEEVEHGGGIDISVTKAIMNGNFYGKG